MSAQNKQSRVAAVVLAAGMSRRMGTPKQLLRIGGETILERTLKNVRASNVSEIVLVLGYAAESVKTEVSTEGLKVVHNADYEQGMFVTACRISCGRCGRNGRTGRAGGPALGAI